MIGMVVWFQWNAIYGMRIGKGGSLQVVGPEVTLQAISNYSLQDFGSEIEGIDGHHHRVLQPRVRDNT